MNIKQLKKKRKLLSILMAVVAIIIIFLLSYYAIHGFSAKDWFFNEDDSVRLLVDKPRNGDIYYDGDSITVFGVMWGEIPKKVYVWDERFNVPISCQISGASFGIELYANDLSKGVHTLCFQGQASDGRWTAVERVDIKKLGESAEGYITANTGNTFVEKHFPEPLALVFRPVEEVLKQTVVTITGGTAEDDLNGDNIPDELQQSPVSPRYNPMNVPLSAIIVYGLIIFVIVLVLLAIVKPYLLKKQKIESKPAYQKWKLKMRSLTNQKQKAELEKEKRRREMLERKARRLEEELSAERTKKPINIYLSDKNKKVEVKNKKQK